MSGAPALSPASIAAVVPAAGRSRRMGREKVLLPFGRSTSLETILETLAGAGVVRTVVVLRPDLVEAARRVRRAGARVIVNPDPDGEMMESIRLGLAAFSPDAAISAFFVWPADHPAVAPGTIAALVAAADAARAWIPSWKGRRGHPALVGDALRGDVLAVPGGKGLRELWRARADAVSELPVEDPGVVANVDTPEQYEAARRAWKASDG